MEACVTRIYGMVHSIPFNGWIYAKVPGTACFFSGRPLEVTKTAFSWKGSMFPVGSPPGSAGWIQSKAKTAYGRQMDWESTAGKAASFSSTRVDDAGVLLESKITAFDLSGDFLWETSSTALGLGPLQPVDMLQTANGATYVVHERWNTPQDADIEIWLLNASGTLLWRQITALPDGTAERPSAMKVNYRGDLILAGTTETALQGRRSFWAPYNKMEQAPWSVPATIDGRCRRQSDRSCHRRPGQHHPGRQPTGVSSGGDIATIKFDRDGIPGLGGAFQ